jgi:integrase
MLTHIKITTAKPAEKAFNLADGHGLFLAVQPNGSKLWKLSFRHLGKQKTLHLGLWPDVGLADARDRRDEARRQIAAGLDPAVERKRARVAATVAAANTFKDVAEEWVQKCEREGRAEITLSKIRWLLGMAYPVIGSLPIANVTPHEVLSVLRKVETNGRYESARRMRGDLIRVFRYGVATVRCQKDVAADLRGAIATPRVKHLAAITNPNQVGELLRAVDGYEGQVVTLMALKLSPHLFVRPGELRQAQWSEFDWDKGVWYLSADRMKMRRPHRVPLSRQVLKLMEELRDHTGYRAFLFPCMGNPITDAGAGRTRIPVNHDHSLACSRSGQGVGQAHYTPSDHRDIIMSVHAALARL